MVDAATLHAVRDAVIDHAKAEEGVAVAVGAARAAGHTWPTIGTILGTSGEAARQRHRQSQEAKNRNWGAASKRAQRP